MKKWLSILFLIGFGISFVWSMTIKSGGSGSMKVASGGSGTAKVSIGAITQVIRYVRLGADAGGDGTTNELTGANCAYQTLNAWEAAQQDDLPSAGERHTVYLSTNGATHIYTGGTTCIIDGWVTDPDHYIEIIVMDASRHHGTFDAGFQLSAAGSNPDIDIDEGHVRVDGVAFSNDGVCMYGDIPSGVSDGDIQFSKILARNFALTGSLGVIHFSGTGSGTATVWNSIVYGSSTWSSAASYWIESDNMTVDFYNCTAVSRAMGFRDNDGNSTMNLTNCLSSATLTGFGNYDSVNYCATIDSSLSGGTGNRNSQTFTFVDSPNLDFHLTVDDGGAKDYGTDLTVTGGFTDDIDGETRSGTWDIGADEYVP